MKSKRANHWLPIAVASITSVAMVTTGHAAAGAWYVDGRCEAVDVNQTSVFAADLLAGRVGPSGLPFSPIVAYDEAVTVREGPYNTMAREEFRREHYPDLDDLAAEAAIENAQYQDAKCMEDAVEAEFAKIKDGLTDDLWRALYFLMGQKDDYHFVGIAAELAVRLDPDRFEQMAGKLKEGRPANAAIFDGVRERWLLPKQR